MATNLLYFGDFKLVKKLECRKDGKACVSASHLVQHEQMHSFEEPKVLLPRKSHGRRSLVGCSPWGLEGSDTTERRPFYFSLSRTGEGNGNPLQCSCLENPMDGGAW